MEKMVPVTPPKGRGRFESEESRQGPNREERSRRDSEGPPSSAERSRDRVDKEHRLEPRTASQEAKYGTSICEVCKRRWVVESQA